MSPGNVIGLVLSPYFNHDVQIRDLRATGTSPSSVIALHGADVIGERWHLTVDAYSALEVSASAAVLRDLTVDHPAGAVSGNTAVDVLFDEVQDAGQPSNDEDVLVAP